jgi:hypothetical protein
VLECGRASGRDSGRGRHVVRGTTGDEAPTNLLSGTELTASETSCSGDRISRAIIFRSIRFEQAQYSFRAVRRPHRDNAPIGLAQSL